MAADSITEIQSLIDRMSAGDLSARTVLIGRAHNRLHRLAAKMFQELPSIPAVEDTEDVLQGSLPRLTWVLEAVPPTAVLEFFRLTSTQMRRELLDLLRRYGALQGRGGKHVAPDTHTPAALADWTRFHKAADSLPETERDVFDLLYSHELTQAEAAGVLRVGENAIRRYWLSARRRLGAFVRRTPETARQPVSEEDGRVDR